MSEQIAKPYTPPDTVLSPKGSVSNLRVLMDTGEDGWSIAALQWEGKERLGVRWNGNPTNPIGNPQSRGIPTWFVLPDELAALLQDRLGDSITGLHEDNLDITRVRVRPLPRRISQGRQQDPIDDEWVLSITDRSRGNLEIMNPRTGHFIAVHSSHVKSLVRDTVSDTPSGPKHGILSLNVQVILEDGRIRLEPLQSQIARIEALYDELKRAGYAGQHDRVRTLIQDVRQSLTTASGTLGPWESDQLEYADAAVRANFLQLALTSVAKAIAVSKLPRADYDYGFNYGRSKSSHATSR